MSINGGMDKENKVPVYTMEHYSVIKEEWYFAICSNMDGPGVYYAKWNKSDRERQILYIVTYIWNLKSKTMNMNIHCKWI